MQAKEDMNFRMAHAKRGDLLAHDMAASDLATLLADPAIAQHYVQADPMFILGVAPLHLAFANAAACNLFDSRQIAKMQHNLLAGQGLASKRIVHLAQSLPIRSNGQLERIRVTVGRLPEALMLSCRKIQAPSGKVWCVFAGVGVRPALLNQTAPLNLVDASRQSAPLEMETKPLAAALPETAPEAVPSPSQDATTETSHAAVSHVFSEIMQSEGATPQPEAAPPVENIAAPADAVPVKTEVRFNWRSDKAHVIQHVSAELLQVLGVPESAIVGRSFADVEREFAIEPSALLTAALERQVTWSGLETQWHVNDAHHPQAMQRVLTFVIGGVPIFKPPHDFIGSRGYGILQGEQFVPSEPSPAATPTTPETQHETRAEAAHSGEAAAVDTQAGGEANRLSDDETDAFRQIGATLTPQITPVAVKTHAPAAATVVPATEPKKAPKLTVQSAMNKAELLQRLPVGVLVMRDGRPLFINAALLNLLDYASQTEFEHLDGLNRMFKGQNLPVLTDESAGDITDTWTLLDRHGEELPMDGRLQVVSWDQKPATLLTFVAAQAHPAEIAVPAPAQEAMEPAEPASSGAKAEVRDLHSILDTATDGVVVVDGYGIVVSLNRSAQALFGYEPNDVLGEPLTMLLAKESQAVAFEYLMGLKTSGVASVLNDGREVMGRASKGGLIPMFMTLGRVGAGENPNFCAVLRDLTQWKKVESDLHEARREAERASAVKSEFLAKISHEIRTPLNAILGFTEVMMEERLGPIANERYKEYLKDIHASGQHVMSLINDLLDLSKIESGKIDLEFISVDVNKVVSDCVVLMQPIAARDHVVMRKSLAPSMPNIVADERALRQIIINILSNAVKFNVHGGQVIVATALTDSGHAVIRVRDTGSGMNEHEISTAMEPFRRLQNTQNVGGTGLGLPITKALVEANRASLTIKSKKDEGTLVEVTFPPTRVLAE